MHYENPNPDQEATRLSAEQIWISGCAGLPLSDHDWMHFITLSRNRFHTFFLGAQHAEETAQRDHYLALEAGFITELMESPGLEKLWVNSDFRSSTKGQSVYKALRRRKFKARFRFV
ncbi:MAG: hypothetical protein ACJAX5_001045 [Patiriisocius sp.]|jgi:hypothetical protein